MTQRLKIKESQWWDEYHKFKINIALNNIIEDKDKQLNFLLVHLSKMSFICYIFLSVCFFFLSIPKSS